MLHSSRKVLLIMMDIAIVAISIYTSYYMRFEGSIPTDFSSQMWIYVTLSVCLGTACMVLFKLYNRVWQYASVGELISIFKAVTVACIASSFLTWGISGQRVPLSIVLRTYETILILMGGSRFIWRIFRDTYYKKQEHQGRAMIIGAGDCGTLVAKELKHNASSLLYPVVFIDDDRSKIKQQIYGIPVIGGRESIGYAVEKYNISTIILALPSAPQKEVSAIIEICKQTDAQLKIVPRLDKVIHGKVTINEIRDVGVEDLLQRDPVMVDLQGIADYVARKVVLITGAGGSIGSELCRQIAPYQPQKLLLLGHGENSIYHIENELRRTFPKIAIESIIADVQDQARINQVFAEHHPKVIFHAAAHKHVPLMENNPSEAIKNNVLGTRNVADAANRYGAERFVLISTDKAVNPTSIMGATKRIAEMYIQSLGGNSRTKFAAVRFGNVLGSRGSVIPYFKEQIARGGPVTVTHPDMIRYFMTIPEAAQLVIQAGAYAQGGEVFILDMGKPVKILDLARDLIRLSGLRLDTDIKIEYTGIRPGEKLYEELLTDEEGLTSTQHNRIFIGKPSSLSKAEMEMEIRNLEHVLGENGDAIKEVVMCAAPGFVRVS